MDTASPEGPKTLTEWRTYVAGLGGPDLMSKARAANSIAFVRALEADGLSPDDITDVLLAFAQRLVEDGQEPPTRHAGFYIDYQRLLNPRRIVAEIVPD